MGPTLDEEFNDHNIEPDLTYDFLSNRKNYTDEQLKLIENKWNNRVKNRDQEEFSYQNIPFFSKESLNHNQMLVCKIIENFALLNKQLIVTDTTGTGKTFTINALSGHLKYKLKRCAPPAIAAFLIKGENIHTLFRIKPRRNKEAYSPLNGKTILKQATGNDKPFGGVSVILTGDPGQLLPVLDSPLYYYPPKDDITWYGYECYKKFDKAISLNTIFRQASTDNDIDPKRFFEILERLRNGKK
ncbi:ATP-dependent DNA helicase PIF1 [Brachionus plicatilis]|uniref:ATP-dependent DNA helicase n=1 Tax=Brachionus plicatilis TaxID=10195 RepID=A0A3M7SF58_BRAPC|nr:ATP-dependent DNA helicase PIF1 [Brachionus plicatilis]